MKKIIIILVILIVLVVGYYEWKKKDVDSTQIASPTWEFVLDESGEMPKTQVNVVWGEKKYDAGIYTGTCVQMAPESVDVELKEAISYSQCWFAGAGNQIAIFEDGGKLSIKSRTIEEESTTAQPFVLLLDL
ncbi:MAG: hypothetical protein A2566_00415 [Candidatus Zambryskibacteria bacterium RIFOXYD1_FULL_40_13]|nr:MAG: hypothetical protein UT25_C0001G0070 [Parcubacteria group bacterium GW2011_GWC1_39_12]KKR19594.1 MAG: hypothetical protein UT49_C0001G0070 [Parcubacteria group bacterium GW2011_GWF1_39_37]KKR35748.1 MAG: hypothetical protein UT68_C0001G0071 [Parcubacteria group bacterium GW2011_GWC2_40_10]KKR52562.1 MAG: hypothetical protein UT89_C0001G0070 [Parcubacteria group bacterium GW2011_GWE1_40_20]KKR65131.1 MAG: hypothetical protein UU06_C0028G0019 [Parcubacteria group bacterium GW2011_GWB1_40_